MATFDGGSRTAIGHDVAAGSAVVWRRVRGERTQPFTMTKAFPEGAATKSAEAWADRMALETLRH
eukprot:8161968-Lingulodinium_polyedra.AAC.1